MADLVTVEREPTLTSIGVTADRLVTANPSRGWLLVVNTSAGAIYLRPTRQPTTTLGIRIATGGYRLFWWEEDYTLPTLEWNIIGDAAGLTFYALEVLFQNTTVQELLAQYISRRLGGGLP